jgi:hypothetical protein
MPVANGIGDAPCDTRGRRCTSTAPIFACVERGFARFPTANGFIDDLVAKGVAKRPDELRLPRLFIRPFGAHRN